MYIITLAHFNWYPLIRERVKEQIAKDKADREAALRKEKASTTAPTAAAAVQSAPSQPTVKKEYDTCRLQVSLRVCELVIQIAI